MVSVSKQQFSVFKQHFTYLHTLFHPHVFPQKFLNNNFQFLNTSTKRALKHSNRTVSLKTLTSLKHSQRFKHSNPLTLHFTVSLTFTISLNLIHSPTLQTSLSSHSSNFKDPSLRHSASIHHSVPLHLCILGGSVGRDFTSITRKDSLSLSLSLSIVFAWCLGSEKIWQNQQILISLYFIYIIQCLILIICDNVY